MSLQWVQWLSSHTAFVGSGHTKVMGKTDSFGIDFHKSGQMTLRCIWNMLALLLMVRRERKTPHLAGCFGVTPAVRNGDCGSGYFCSCDGGCMESPTLRSWGAIIAPEETPASHPLPSCVPAPAAVCRRLSVSTTSCDVPVLILARGARKLTSYCFYAFVGFVDTWYNSAGFASLSVKVNFVHQRPKKTAWFLWPVVGL